MICEGSAAWGDLEGSGGSKTGGGKEPREGAFSAESRVQSDQWSFESYFGVWPNSTVVCDQPLSHIWALVPLLASHPTGCGSSQEDAAPRTLPALLICGDTASAGQGSPLKTVHCRNLKKNTGMLEDTQNRGGPQIQVGQCCKSPGTRQSQ